MTNQRSIAKPVDLATWAVPALRDPNLAEIIARLGIEHGFEAAAGLVGIEDQRLRSEISRAARELVVRVARLYERTFGQTFVAALTTEAGGTVKVTIKLSEEKSVEVVRRIGDG